jgi:hypothetical protein
VNGNGAIDSGEPVLATQLTVAGSYNFSGLAFGDYIVQVTDTNLILTGFALTSDTTNPLVYSLAIGEDFNQADFGYQQQDASIGDFIFNDLNGNGVHDVDEPGINGVFIDLILDINADGIIDESEIVLKTTMTSNGGQYSFNNLSLGNYIVNVTDTDLVLNGYILTDGELPTAQTLVAGQVVSQIDFGYLLIDVAELDTVTIIEDSLQTTIDVLNNDSNIGSLPREIIAITTASNGIVSFTSNQVFYTPNMNYCNDGLPIDSFTYTISGGSTASVDVSVNCVNDAPDFMILGDLDASSIINFGNTTLELPNFANSFVFGPENESNQSVDQFDLIIESDSSMILNNAFLDTDGTLYLDFSLNYGVALIQVSMQDNGGISNGGENTSEIKQFTIYRTNLIFQNGYEMDDGLQVFNFIESLKLKSISKSPDIYYSDEASAYIYGHPFTLIPTNLINPSIPLLKLWLTEVLNLEDPYGDIDKDSIPNLLDSDSF